MFDRNSFPLADCLVYFEWNEISPEYLRDSNLLRGKKYCLEGLVNNSIEVEDEECLKKKFDPLNLEEWPSAEELHLDEQQYKAFQLALTNKVAIIQGPPGTGKTFIGKKIVTALLKNTQQTPIVICCLTNHALDQFLEGMLEYTKNIIRLGSQSKSIKLEAHTFDTIIDTMQMYKQSGFKETRYIETNSLTKKALNYLRQYVPELLQDHKGDNDSQLQLLKEICCKLNDEVDSMYSCQYKYLEEDSLNKIISSQDKAELLRGSSTHSDLLLTNVMEWLGVTRKSDLYVTCEKDFIKFNREISHNKSKYSLSLWSLNLNERFKLFYLWRETNMNILDKNIKDYLEEYRTEMMKNCSRVINSDKVEILKHCEIIGVTTTGAAKFRHLIANTGASILIIEEAAEVLESHIIASLLPTTKHLILIGDHKQLRPLPSNHELAEIYNLKISMFERLFTNKLPSETLVYQHRMRPCIADLLVNDYLYDNLKSFENVYKYPEIKGVSSSVFFLNHSTTENENSTSSSSSNQYEAKMAVNLVNYFLMQSYTPDQITVLATYAAQVNLITNFFIEANIEDVKLTTVDNYQGEENDIIILSFVRNNKSGIIGFLKENNRVCVALSRAKKGMFCLGNFTLYASKSPLWKTIVEKLEKQNMIGEKFPLKCSKHESSSYAQTPDEINEFIESGCKEQCNFKLPCGHNCTKRCHYIDEQHLQYQCKYPCERYITEKDRCPRLCFQRCKKVKKELVTLKCGHECRPSNHNPNLICLEEVTKLLPCKHLAPMLCSTDILKYQCKASVTITLACGHSKTVPCYKQNNLNVICREKRPIFSPCGHTIYVECCLNLTPNERIAYCTQICEAILTCEHPCIGDCKFCFDFGIHAMCTAKCNEQLRCGHPCEGHCNSPCPPCKQKCAMICSHGTVCINSCYRPCVQCTKPCELRCKHVRCPKLCFEKCSVEPCTEICLEKLPCGHKCIGLCGDPCPYLCRECNEVDIDSGDPKRDYYVWLEDCDHVVEERQLNIHVEECIENFQWPNCPVCSKAIYKSLRYKNQLLKAKKSVFDSCDNTEIINDINFLLRTAFNETDFIPTEFTNVYQKINSILFKKRTTYNILTTLKQSVLHMRGLIGIHQKLKDFEESDWKETGLSRFETLLLWLYNHLEYASYQQTCECEKTIDELKINIDKYSNCSNPVLYL